MEKTCKECRWTACRNYGKDIGICFNYLPSLEQLKEDEKRENEKDERRKEEQHGTISKML